VVVEEMVTNTEASGKADQVVDQANELSMIVFSGDLDKALAAFIIANGAAVMDKPVTMFFTFWGLNVLRRNESIAVKKGLVERMFGWMMPRGADKLKLSKMNMGGMGTMMMKRVMARKNVYSLPQLMQSARDAGVRLVACTMSMDVMGITKEELIDGVEFGGVASFLDAADRSKTTLFI
jgi:peroxiredoxin family protein